MATMKKNGGPCGAGETLIKGNCVKKGLLTTPAGIAAIGTGIAGIGAAIKNRMTKKKEAKAEVAEIKNMIAKASKKKMMTGGMVNPNATVKKQTVPGSKGVMSGENPKASASKVAKGRSGGISKAPKTATPKAMYGMSMKPGMMRKGGAKKK
jgi:hypothetical protein